MDDIIKIKGLCKSFGTLKAVSDLSFRVKKGELFAFLGANGAGKSTTISIMCGTMTKDAGEITVCGEDYAHINKAMSKTGVVFQSSVLDKALTVKENLASRAALYGITGRIFSERLEELDRLLDLKDILARQIGKLSGGQRRKADIARALVHKPELLILDEPTTGLDPATRKTLWEAISQLRIKHNMTVFLTTHYMEEAADADYVVIIDGGKIAAEGTPNRLKNLYANDYLTVYNVPEESVSSLGYEYERVKDGWRLSLPSPGAAADLISSRRELFSDYEFVKGRMDDVFLNVTGKQSEQSI